MPESLCTGGRSANENVLHRSPRRSVRFYRDRQGDQCKFCLHDETKSERSYAANSSSKKIGDRRAAAAAAGEYLARVVMEY